MIKSIISLLIISFLLVGGVWADDDDDDDNKNCVEFIYNSKDIGKGAIDSGNYYTAPSGKIYLFPHWAGAPITPIPTPIPTPTPTIYPTRANAFDSCKQCHKGSESKYTFAKWNTTLHQKSNHKSKACTVCHNLSK